MITRTIAGCTLLVLVSVWLAGCQTPSSGSALATSSTTTNSTPPLIPARFQATVYEVQLPAGRSGALDGKSLTARAATAEELQQALAAQGTSRILYRLDQPVDVRSERISIGSREPVVAGSRTANAGQMINTVTYQSVGLSVRLSAEPPADPRRGKPEVTVSVQLSTLAPSSVALTPGNRVSSTRNVALDHRETLEFNRPRVMVSVTSTSPEAEAPAMAYVIRYLFGPPAR